MEPTKLSNQEKHERLLKLMSHFDTAMLVTQTDTGELRSRPLSIAHNEDDPEKLYFATAFDSAKVHELEHNTHVNVSMQETHRFISISGYASISRDRNLIEKLWSEAWKVWFPNGKGDPSLCLIVVEPSEATYWDAAGILGVSYLFDMAKAFVTGTRPSADEDERHAAKVEFDA